MSEIDVGRLARALEISNAFGAGHQASESGHVSTQDYRDWADEIAGVYDRLGDSPPHEPEARSPI